jgi:hypothetical protein
VLKGGSLKACWSLGFHCAWGALHYNYLLVGLAESFRASSR